MGVVVWDKKKKLPEFIVVSTSRLSKNSWMFSPVNVGEHPTIDKLLAFVRNKIKFIESVPMDDGYSLEAVGVVFVRTPPILEDGTVLEK